LGVAAGGFAALVAIVPVPAAAQCDASVKPAPGEVGYKKRDYACEGMYVGLQSGPIGVQVVSLVRGALRYTSELPADGLLYVKVRHRSHRLDPRVRVIGRARQANLHWALDGAVRFDSVLRWDLAKVVRPMRLENTSIGLYGVTHRLGPDANLGGPVFVPLEVTPSEDPAPTEAVELVVRVPAAAEICWSVSKRDAPPAEGLSAQCTPKVGPIDGNADGYFRIVIPPMSDGEHRVAIRWRPRGAQAFGNPVHLSVQFW
jgi:hypothetical protein